MHLHILGICGTFMGGLAALAVRAGHRVTGCDANVYPPMSEQLERLGIELLEGYGAGQLGLRPDVWVVGNVVSRGNPLIEAILDARAPYVSGPQWLAAQVLAGRQVLAVAGTHGKTTTASLLAWILEACGRNPGFLIGGVPNGFDASARLTDAPLFVIEADEYDSAFFDKRSKFVHYRPWTAILNNLEFDHADIFADLAAIETQFHHLVRTVPRSGRLIVNGNDAALARVLARGCWSECERFGVADGWDLVALEPAPAEAGERRPADAAAPAAHEVRLRGEPLGILRSPLPGAHNRLNALAAIAAAAHAGVPAAQAVEAVARFPGVRRRLELRGSVGGIAVLDDFAHHPTAIRATIAAARERLGAAGRVLAVLEPRSNTMRMGTMRAELAASLAGADRVFGYGAGLDWDLRAALAPLGDRARVSDALDRLVAAVCAEARAGDQIVVMSNGSFGGIHARLLASLRRP